MPSHTYFTLSAAVLDSIPVTGVLRAILATAARVADGSPTCGYVFETGGKPAITQILWKSYTGASLDGAFPSRAAAMAHLYQEKYPEVEHV